FYAEPGLLFQNTGDGHFTNVSAEAGPLASYIENSRGLALGDVDNDGGIDLLINNCGGAARLLKNDFKPRGHWLLIRAIDPSLKRDAYGAKIIATAGGKTFTRWVNPGYSYLSSNDPRVHFGIGSATSVDLQIQWPDGITESFPGVQADQVITLRK